MASARAWFLAQETGTGKSSPPCISEPPPYPPPSLVFCNSDASWCKTTSRAGLGWVIMDSPEGTCSEGQSPMSSVSSPLMAEALAVKALLLAVSLTSSSNVWIRSESLELIRAINSTSYPVELYGVLKEIGLLSSSFAFIYFSHVSRSCNTRADYLAKNAPLHHHSSL